MCGIFGGHPGLVMPNAEALLLHRGPDQQGRKLLTDRRGEPFIMGMTRLSIVNREPMDVPFAARGAYIAFNGEIYNWREIRERLEKRGVVFQTQTDTEVALHAYLEWGASCLEQFNGMFALAIWRDGELFLARDRLGKKPLFYQRNGHGLAFASEIKALANLEYKPVEICEKLEFYFDEHSPFQDVNSLKPGEYMVYDTGTGEARLSTWWSFPAFQGTVTDMDAAVAEFVPLLEDACRLRKLADVPITVFLSGGVDSSLIQAILKLDATYTVQFPEFADTINEQMYVEEYARYLGFEAHMVSPTKDDFHEVFPTLCRHIEFPVGSFSIFPLFCMAQRARADGYVVALSGEGADELFNGYFRNEMLLQEKAHIDGYLRGDYAHLAGRYFGSELERFARMARRGGPEDITYLVNQFKSHWDGTAPFCHNLAMMESMIFLQALLVMADRMSMANSLEVRNPFLDYRIVEFSSRLAPELRFVDGRGKCVLREALRQVVGNADLGIVKRQVKHGLPSPVNRWFYRKDSFDRRDWNNMMLGECLVQLRRD